MTSKMSAMRTAFRQVRATVLANMKARYRGSAAGFVWVVLNPLIIYGVQSFVFNSVLGLQIPNYFVFLISGLLPWLFIAQTLDMCTNVFVNSGRLLKSYPIHPLVCLLAQVLDNFFNLNMLIMLLIIPGMLFTDFKVWKFILLPIPLVACVFGVIGMAWFLATVQIFFRDLKFILGFVLNVSFFITPIFYPESFIEPRFQWILKFNPFRYFLLPFRDLIEDPVPMAFWQDSMISILLAGTFVLAAAAYWRTKRNVALFYL